jgi:hypothetical protein
MQRRKGVETPTRLDTDTGDMPCGRVMEELRHGVVQAFTG